MLKNMFFVEAFIRLFVRRWGVETMSSGSKVKSQRFKVQQPSFEAHDAVIADEGSIWERMLDNCFANVYRSFTP